MEIKMAFLQEQRSSPNFVDRWESAGHLNSLLNLLRSKTLEQKQLAKDRQFQQVLEKSLRFVLYKASF